MTSDSDGKRHTARYTREMHGSGADERLDSRVFHRNAPPIIAMLSQYLLGRTGTVLEIGAGTGQHAAAFALAFPTLDWVPSDPFPDHLASIRAWRRELHRHDGKAIELDAAEDWARLAPVRALGPLSGIYAGNVTHIAPWAVTEGVLVGAGRCLAPEGKLFLYGPFREGSEYFGEGNRRFDAALRADNADWGLRDMDHIEAFARAHGLRPVARHAMPANNHLMVLTRLP
ncbi:DUF938 domain-containing protein [Aliiruegeria sabulilitoris]|uniref:DUF938 domain-containing protein n=1 Tax=Aliiruegeria sabulilitoris TaxID=1510458 RepID=UPI000831742A|nr:DUF938 domain-containing protein [Aliiruegeria sabulilitoris]NDR55260.1 DUF938 domain-containing protein [Pseudoruegeria sp. M32A2M]